MSMRQRPIFNIRLLAKGAKEGTAVDIADRVVSMSFEEEEKKADKLEIQLNNWDLTAFDDPTWKKGNVLEVNWGYPGNMSPIRRMVIQKVRGGTELRIEAHDPSMLMHKTKKTRNFSKTSLKDVVSKIAHEYSAEIGSGVDVVVDDKVASIKHVRLVQHNETDAEFLAKLAKRYGLVFYVDQNGVHFKQRNVKQAPFRELQWFTDRRGDWMDFSIEEDITDKKPKVALAGVNPMAGKKMVAEADNKSAKRDGLAPMMSEFVVSQSTGLITHRLQQAKQQQPSAESKPENLKHRADGKFRNDVQHSVELEGTIVGDPQFGAKKVFVAMGLGKRLSGRYYVKSCRHMIQGEGYTTKFKAVADGHGGYGKKNGDAKSEAAVNKKKVANQEVRVNISQQTGLISYKPSGEGQ